MQISSSYGSPKSQKPFFPQQQVIVAENDVGGIWDEPVQERPFTRLSLDRFPFLPPHPNQFFGTSPLYHQCIIQLIVDTVGDLLWYIFAQFAMLPISSYITYHQNLMSGDWDMKLADERRCNGTCLSCAVYGCRSLATPTAHDGWVRSGGVLCCPKHSIVAYVQEARYNREMTDFERASGHCRAISMMLCFDTTTDVHVKRSHIRYASKGWKDVVDMVFRFGFRR